MLFVSFIQDTKAIGNIMCELQEQKRPLKDRRRCSAQATKSNETCSPRRVLSVGRTADSWCGAMTRTTSLNERFNQQRLQTDHVTRNKNHHHRVNVLFANELLRAGE